MMGAALPQSPAQNGLLSILAATGATTPAGTTGEGGFEQLFASLPTATVGAAVPAAPSAANPFAVQLTTQPGTAGSVATDTPLSFDAAALPAATATSAPPAAALFGMPQPIAEPTVEAEMAADVPAKVPAVPAAPAAATEKADIDSAAAAASLLIAVATPLKTAASTAEKAAPVDQSEADAPADGSTPAQAVGAPTQPVAQPAAAIVEAPAAAAVVATATPAADKPVVDKTSKPAAAAPTTRHADTAATSSQPTITAKPETAPSQPAMPLAATAEPKAAKPVTDAGASMTVLFTQTAMQGAAPLAEAARAAPVAERTLDMTSDDQWIAQLAADIAATKSDKGDLSFRLMPRHLGRLDVAMSLDGDSVSLKLDTQHEATAAIVQAAQPRLVEDLRQQGVRVTEAQVTHTPVETGRQQQNQSQGRGTTPDPSHLIETAADQADSTHDERTADRRGRFA